MLVAVSKSFARLPYNLIYDSLAARHPTNICGPVRPLPNFRCASTLWPRTPNESQRPETPQNNTGWHSICHSSFVEMPPDNVILRAVTRGHTFVVAKRPYIAHCNHSSLHKSQPVVAIWLYFLRVSIR